MTGWILSHHSAEVPGYDGNEGQFWNFVSDLILRDFRSLQSAQIERYSTVLELDEFEEMCS